MEHHRSLGVSKFYVMDVNSTVPFARDVADYIASGLIDYFYRYAAHVATLIGQIGSMSSRQVGEGPSGEDLLIKMGKRAKQWLLLSVKLTSDSSTPAIWCLCSWSLRRTQQVRSMSTCVHMICARYALSLCVAEIVFE